MTKKNSLYDIESFDDSWEHNPKDGLPQSGAQVRKFIGEQFGSLHGRVDRLEEEVANGTVDFRFMNLPSGNVVINGTAAYNFPLFVRSMVVNKDGTEEEFDQNVFIEIAVSVNGGSTSTLIGSVRANENTSVNITPYVSDGSYFVLRAYNESGNTKRSSSYAVTMANMSVKTRGNNWWSTPYVNGSAYYVPLLINTNVPSVLKATLTDKNGVIRSSVTIPSSQLSENYDLHLTHPLENGGSAGIYNINIELATTSEEFSGLSADPVNANIICVGAVSDLNIFVANNHGEAFKNYATNRVFDYVVSVGYGNPTLRIVSKIEGVVISDTGDMAVVSNSVTPYLLTIEADRMDDADFNVDVEVFLNEEKVYEKTITISNKEGYSATAGIKNFIRFSGRNNSQSNKEIFYDSVSGEEIIPEITGVGWSGADGYVNEAMNDGTSITFLRMLAGSRMVLPITPLAMRPSEGRTIELVYRVSNVRDFDKTLISCMSGGNGFNITASEIAMFTPSAKQHDDQNAGLDTEWMRITIVVRPQDAGTETTVDNFSACEIFLNGCRNRWFAYNRDLNIDSPITFGSDYADIDLFAVRTYDKVLSEQEVEQNTCNMQFTEAEKAAYKARNAIRETGKVLYNRVRALCNVIVFQCDELPSRTWSKEQTTNATIATYYRDPSMTNEVVSVTNLAWQGTTSHNYGTNAEYGGLGQNYKWTAGSTKMCAKANWASSMQSHKIALTEAYTDLAIACGIISAGQRISILQKPMVGFQLKSDGTYEFIGLFTVGADKGDKGTFGFTSKTLFMEGKDNEPLGTNFLLPWNEDTVSVDDTFETYSLCGVKAWEDASKKPEYINSRWVEAYNLVYACSQKIKPISSLDALEGKDTSVSYWLTSTKDLYYYNASKSAWMQSGINMITSLVDKGYGLTSSQITADYDEVNELFKNARKEKFKKEITTKFSKDFFVYHIAFIEFFGCSDNLSKNTYPFILDATNENALICWRQDDLDSSLQTENQGKNYKKYCVEIEDNYSAYGRDSLMVFNGTENQFWLLVRECFAEDITNFMRNKFIPSMRYGSASDPLTMYNAWCKRYFFDNAQNHFSEALYNETGRIRYGYGHLSSGYQYAGIALSQDSGNCYYAEKQWLRMRYVYMSSKYTEGNFAAGSKTDVFTTRPYAAEDGVGNTFDITPAIYMYPSVQNGESVIRGERIYPGTDLKTWSVTLPATQGDQEQRINGMSYIASLGAMYNAAIRGNVNVNGKMLQELFIGTVDDLSRIRSRVTGIGIGDATSLQELVLANIETLAGVVDLSECVSLLSILAEGTSVTSVQLCDGGNLTTLHLPASITNLSLVGKKKLNDLTIEGIDNLTSLEVTGCNDYTVGKALEILTNLYV